MLLHVTWHACGFSLNLGPGSPRVLQCVSSVNFEGHRAKPLTGLIRRAPKGRPTRTPPVAPHPESLAAQAAYTEALLPGSGSGPNCFQALGFSPGPAIGSQIVNIGVLPRACHRVPDCEQGDPSSPTGTAAAECLGDEERPALPPLLPWEAPAAQISQRAAGGGPCSPDFPKSPIAAGPRTTH
jgi:hypothetical protein